MKDRVYTVYVIACRDKTLYTGITTDLKRRLSQHGVSKSGARYTRGRGPFEIRYTAQFPTRALALREESRIKKLSRQKKLLMVQSGKR